MYKRNKEGFNFKEPGGRNKELNLMIVYLEGKYKPLLKLLEGSKDPCLATKSINDLCFDQPYLKNSSNMVEIFKNFKNNILSIENDRGELSHFNTMLGENPSFYIHLLCHVLPSISHFRYPEKKKETERKETPIPSDYFDLGSDALPYSDDSDHFLGAEVIDASSFLSMKETNEEDFGLPLEEENSAIHSITLTKSFREALIILFGKVPSNRIYILDNISSCLIKALVDTKNAKVCTSVVPSNVSIEIKPSFVKWIGTSYLKQKNLPSLKPNVKKNRIERWKKLYYTKNGTLMSAASSNRCSKPNKEVYKNQEYCNSIGYRLIPDKTKFMMDNVFSVISLKSKRIDLRFHFDIRTFVNSKMREKVLTPSLKVKLQDNIKKSFDSPKSLVEDRFYKKVFDKLGKDKIDTMVGYISRDYKIAMNNARIYLELYFLLLIFKDKVIYFTSFADYRLREYYGSWPLNLQATPVIRDLMTFNYAYLNNLRTIKSDAISSCIQNSALMSGDENLLKIAKVIHDDDFLASAYDKIAEVYKVRGFTLERKWVKSMVMCRMYGEGFTSRVKNLFSKSMARRIWSVKDNAYNISPSEHYKWCKKVADILEEVLEVACPKLLNFILVVEKLADERLALINMKRKKKEDPRIDISSFKGWDRPIPDNYLLINSKFGKCIQTNWYSLYTKESIKQFLSSKSKEVVKRYYYCQFKKKIIGYTDANLLRPDHEVMRRGVVPNMFHSVDAAIMNGVTKRFRLKGKLIIRIHDCFDCLESDVVFLNKCYRLELRNVLSRPYIEEFLKDNFDTESSDPLLNKGVKERSLRVKNFKITKFPLAKEVEDDLKFLLEKGKYPVVGKYF